MLADVILPIPVPVNYTYRVPKTLVERVKEGHRVIVPLGKSKYTLALFEKYIPQHQVLIELKTYCLPLMSKLLFQRKQLKFGNGWLSITTVV